MATQLFAVAFRPTVNGAQVSAQQQLATVDIDPQLLSGETSGYTPVCLVFELDGLSEGDLIGVDWGAPSSATNSFDSLTMNAELRPR